MIDTLANVWIVGMCVTCSAIINKSDVRAAGVFVIDF